LRYGVIDAFLGWLGATDLLLLIFYVFATYSAISSYDLDVMNQLLLPVYSAAILMTASAIALIYGSYLIWRNNKLKGGIINVLAGTLVPVPTYVYFTFFSQPTLLSWLSPVGWFTLAPAIISGAISIFSSKFHA
jgi:hypothetical protein